jgi:hypothetical protein
MLLVYMLASPLEGWCCCLLDPERLVLCCDSTWFVTSLNFSLNYAMVPIDKALHASLLKQATVE